MQFKYGMRNKTYCLTNHTIDHQFTSPRRQWQWLCRRYQSPNNEVKTIMNKIAANMNLCKAETNRVDSGEASEKP
jgi:hypothetical protein